MSTLYQVGTFVGLLQGVYDGDTTVKTLLEKGNIGLGTYDGVAGEMIIVDGKCYHADSDGKLNLAHPTTKTPFAVVAQFHPTITFSLNNIDTIKKLNQRIDAYLTTNNIFYMIQIEGSFHSIQGRSESCQPMPYKTLQESLAITQRSFELPYSQAILVATRCPTYYGSSLIDNFHYHFITQDKTLGGHVFDLSVESCKVSIMPIREFHLSLMDTIEFDQADLTLRVDAIRKKVE